MKKLYTDLNKFLLIVSIVSFALSILFAGILDIWPASNCAIIALTSLGTMFGAIILTILSAIIFDMLNKILNKGGTK